MFDDFFDGFLRSFFVDVMFEWLFISVKICFIFIFLKINEFRRKYDNEFFVVKFDECF